MSSSTRRDFLRNTAAIAGVAGLEPSWPRPNILVLCPDQHRFDWTGESAQVPVRTPNLDALARRGVRFSKAVVPSPLCAPSRACLASGKEYERCGVASNGVDYPLTQVTYYSLLNDSGYHVAGCGKLDLHKKTLDWGLNGRRLLKELGFSDGIDNAGKRDAVRSGAAAPKDPYMAYLHQRGLAAAHVEDFRRRRDYAATFPTPLPDDAYCDNWIGNNGLALMRRFPKGKPWHLVVNFTGPHEPMDITRSMEDHCRGFRFPQPNRNTQFPPEIHTAIRQNYAAMIENIDRWTGIYMEELRRRDELGDTLIVYVSDHGEMLGDHNRWGKSLPYQPSIGVPLIVAGPGVEQGLLSQALVTTLDLTATFLDYAAIPRPCDMDSRSLRPLLEGRVRSHREFVRSGLGSWRTVMDQRYKLIRGFDPESRPAGRLSPEQAKSLPPLLFDLQNDPLENTDIAAKAPNTVARLSKCLDGA